MITDTYKPTIRPLLHANTLYCLFNVLHKLNIIDDVPWFYGPSYVRVSINGIKLNPDFEYDITPEHQLVLKTIPALSSQYVLVENYDGEIILNEQFKDPVDCTIQLPLFVT